jgi:RsiW-degrading membrane proteinase PrsW (M82 family)
LADIVIDYSIRVAVSLLPVLLFLLTLNLLDSYKLVRPRAMTAAIAVGFLVAVASMLVYLALMRLVEVDRTMYAWYGAPVLEELLKSLYIVYLLRAQKIGFMVDAAIMGFAVGAGFAIVENLYYIHDLPDPRVAIWIVRGFGTAFMHGGATALFGIMSKNLYDRRERRNLGIFLPGFVIAVLIHSFYNHFLLNPVISTVLIHILLPLVILTVFYRSERATRQWLGSQFDTDQELLDIISSGRVSNTHLGVFFRSIRESFPPEVVVDMLCYLRLHVELAIHAKGLLLMRDAGFDPKPTPEITAKIAEMQYLRKSIGKTGQLALSPLVHTSSRDLWQLQLLDKR